MAIKQVNRIRRKKIGSLFAALALAAGFAAWNSELSFAQEGDISVTATVDRNEMRPGDAFTYSVTVTSTNQASFSEPQLPNFKDFDVLNVWSSNETRGSFVGGQVRTEQTRRFNYQLVPRKEGTFEIGAAEVTVNGQALRTNPINIKVMAGAPVGPQAPPPRQFAQPDPMEDPLDDVDEMFSRLLRRHLGRGTPRGNYGNVGTDPFFIHVDVDKLQVYQNEQVTVSWYLVTNVNILDIDTLKYPTLEGFWKEDIELATRLNFKPEIINGVRYNKALLASFALFPIKAGQLKIDTYRAKCRIMGYNAMGIPQEGVVTKESEEVTVAVMPIPEKDRPLSFTGGVGDFSVTARVDAQEVKTNQPFSYKIRIDGRGNAKFADMPKITFPEGFEVYDTKSEMKFYTDGRSFKEYETLLVPRSVGEFEIGPFEMSFFHPAQKKFITRSLNSVAVNVQKGVDAGLIPSLTNLPSDEAPERKATLPPISLSAGEPAAVRPALVFGVWGLLFAAGFGGLAFYGLRELRPRDRRKDLRTRVKARMTKLRGELDRGNWRAVGAEAVNLISGTLGEIAGTGGASFEFAKLVETAPPSFRRDVAPHLDKVMQKFQVIGFAPEGVVGSLKDKKKLRELVDESEKLLLMTCQYDFTSSDEAGDA